MVPQFEKKCKKEKRNPVNMYGLLLKVFDSRTVITGLRMPIEGVNQRNPKCLSRMWQTKNQKIIIALSSQFLYILDSV